MSSHANTQRRCLPKYAYFSRRSGGWGRYIPTRSPTASGSATDTIPPVSPGRHRLPRGPDGEPASVRQDVVATNAAHVSCDLEIGGRSVPEIEDHEGGAIAADRCLVGRRSWKCSVVAEVVGA